MCPTFHEKLHEIRRTPHKLRRMIGVWPYYQTLQKPLQSISQEDMDKLREEEPIVIVYESDANVNANDEKWISSVVSCCEHSKEQWVRFITI